jgi:hypothetical protein
MERRSHNWSLGWRLALAPTRALFDSQFMKTRKGWDIKRWSKAFLLVNSALLLLLKPFWLVKCWPMKVVVALVLFAIPWSRIVEILYAFYYDALEKIARGSDQRSSLRRGDRFRLIGISYVEVSICFATFYHAMPQGWFIVSENCLHSNWFLSALDWLYFSWITITTAGYGDFAPSHPLARVIVMSELAVGLFFIVFAVGSYFAYKEELSQP